MYFAIVALSMLSLAAIGSYSYRGYDRDYSSDSSYDYGDRGTRRSSLYRSNRRSYRDGRSRNRGRSAAASDCDNPEDVDTLFPMRNCNLRKCKRDCKRKASQYEALELTGAGCDSRSTCACEANLCSGFDFGGTRRRHRGSRGFGASSWSDVSDRGSSRGRTRGSSRRNSRRGDRYDGDGSSRRNSRRRGDRYDGDGIDVSTGRSNRRNSRTRRAGTGRRRGRARCDKPAFEAFSRQDLCDDEEACVGFCENEFSSDLYDAALEENRNGKVKCVCLACEGGRTARGRYQVRRRARNAVCDNPRVREPFSSSSCNGNRDEIQCIENCERKYKNKLANAYCASGTCCCETCSNGRRKRRRRRQRNEDCIDTTIDILRYGESCSSDRECNSKCNREFQKKNVQNAFCDANSDCCCDRCLSRQELKDEERQWERYGADKNRFVDMVSDGGGCGSTSSLRDLFDIFGK